MDDGDRRVLLNAHDAVTLFYSLLLVLGVREGLVRLLLRPDGSPVSPLSLPVERLAVFAVFLLLVARFFLGNVRHVDSSYIEPLFRADPPLERVSAMNRMFDFAWMLFQAIVLFYLGTLVGRTREFFVVVTFLLVVDIVWLSYSSLRLDKVTEGGSLSSEMIWVLNNAAHVVLFLLLFATVPVGTGRNWWLAFVFLGIVNSVLDVGLTWDEYFPSLRGRRDSA